MSDLIFYGLLIFAFGAVAGFCVACRLFAAMQQDLLSTFSKSPER